MGQRKDDDDRTLGVLGAYAIGGPGLVGAQVLGGLLGEGGRNNRPYDPAPIGSDPWLLAEVKAALGREAGLDASGVTVEALEAIVTLRGSVRAAGDIQRATHAAQTVQGIKTLRVELVPG